MKNIKVVIGSNFGDEGKGLMTDYFCAKYEETLNVRFNGGSQAGHTVTSNGAEHVFHHIGAGSFHPGCATYLSPAFYVNPIDFNREYHELQEKGFTPKVYVSAQCQVVLPYDIFVNQMLEEKRGKTRHGSCGAGIYECRLRNCQPEGALRLADLLQTVNPAKTMKRIRDEYCLPRLNSLGLNPQHTAYGELWHSDILLNRFCEDLSIFLDSVRIVRDNQVIHKYQNIVFEGAQGLLLDMDNTGYMPHLTPTNTGLKNVVRLLGELQDRAPCRVEVCYVSRTYFTRHGAGRFDTEVARKELLGHPVQERTNQPNCWQGRFRFGYFDQHAYESAIKKDLQHLHSGCGNIKIACAFTHLNTTNGKILLPERDAGYSELIRALGIRADKAYGVWGQERNDVQLIHMAKGVS